MTKALKAPFDYTISTGKFPFKARLGEVTIIWNNDKLIAYIAGKQFTSYNVSSRSDVAECIDQITRTAIQFFDNDQFFDYCQK